MKALEGPGRDLHRRIPLGRGCAWVVSLPVMTLGRPRNGYRRFSRRSPKRGEELTECGRARTTHLATNCGPPGRIGWSALPVRARDDVSWVTLPEVEPIRPRPCFLGGWLEITKEPGRGTRVPGRPGFLVGQLGCPVEGECQGAAASGCSGKGRRSS